MFFFNISFKFSWFTLKGKGSAKSKELSTK